MLGEWVKRQVRLKSLWILPVFSVLLFESVKRRWQPTGACRDRAGHIPDVWLWADRMIFCTVLSGTEVIRSSTGSDQKVGWCKVWLQFLSSSSLSQNHCLLQHTFFLEYPLIAGLPQPISSFITSAVQQVEFSSAKFLLARQGKLYWFSF